MTLSTVLRAAGLSCLLALPTALLAQDEPLILPDRDEVEAGEAYVAGINRDWQVRCIRSEQDAVPDRCEMFQLLEEENGNPVAEIRVAIALNPTDEAVATATILTPLDTLLSPGLQIGVDENEPAVVPYAFCRPIGCFVQIALSQDDVDVFAAGADAQIVLFALVRDQSGQMGGAPVRTLASLRGFTASYEDIAGRMEVIRAFIAEQQAAAAAAAEAEGDGEGEGEATE